MITADQSFRGQRVLVLGLGLHGGGEATVRWFVKQGAKVRVNDTKSAEQLAPTLKKLGRLPVVLHLGGHRRTDIDWAQVLAVNPGVPYDHPDLRYARQKKKLVVNEATLFIAQAPGTIVGVTGTRGKTTTTYLISAMLKAARRPVIMSGNVRDVAMLDYLDRVKNTTTSVLELSSYQLELLPLIRRSPQVAVYTNLKVDHLSRHGTMQEYGGVKANILRYQSKNDVAILNADNPWTKKAAKLTPGRSVWFSRHAAAGSWSVFLQRGWVVEKKRGSITRLVPLSAWRLPGDHNLENLLAAIAAARAVGLPVPAILKAVRVFTGVPHRQERVRVWKGHEFINDTTATSPDGALAALAVYPTAVFIVGGTDKKLDFRPLAKRMVTQNISAVFLPGNGTDILLGCLRRYRYRAPHVMARSMEEAVHHAIEVAKPKQAIVLSPGAASFGLFVHEFDRGEKFIKAVRSLR